MKIWKTQISCSLDQHLISLGLTVTFNLKARAQGLLNCKSVGVNDSVCLETGGGHYLTLSIHVLSL